MSIVVVPTRTGPVAAPAAYGSGGAKGDPGSPGEGYATRGLMAARAAPALLDDVYLTEPVREGKFVVKAASDYTAEIAVDAGHKGMFVPSTADATKVYARVIREAPVIPHFWYEATDPDFGASIQRAVDFLQATAVAPGGFSNRAARLFIPRDSQTYTITSTIDINQTLIIEGEGTGGPGGNATLLEAVDCTAFRVQQYNTSGASGSMSPSSSRGAGTLFRNLGGKGSYSGTEAEYHFIHARGTCSGEGINAENFAGDAWHEDSSDILGNCNNSQLTNFFFSACRDGISRNGSNAQGSTAGLGQITGMRRWGFKDDALLTNTYLPILFENNGHGLTISMVSTGGRRHSVKDGREAQCLTNAPPASAADDANWYFVENGGVDTFSPAWASGMAGYTLRAGGVGRTTSASARHLIFSPHVEGSQGPIQAVSPSRVIGGEMTSSLRPRGGCIYEEVVAPSMLTVFGDWAVQALGDTSQTAWVNGNGMNIGAGKLYWGPDGNFVVGHRVAGWGPATGTATRTTFDTTTVTLPQLAERLKALIDDLHSSGFNHGLIGP